MDLKALTQDTLRLLEERDDLRAARDAACAGTVVHRPGELDAFVFAGTPATTLRIEVTGETTAEAASPSSRWRSASACAR